MKSYKKKEKSLYTLLIKNYVIFAAVLLLAVQILGLLEELMDQKITRLPRIDHPVGEQEKLADEDYGSLSMKALLGTEGYFDIYTAAGERLYTDYDAFGSSYTLKEISLIPECNTHVSYEIKNYEMEDGSRCTVRWYATVTFPACAWQKALQTATVANIMLTWV